LRVLSEPASLQPAADACAPAAARPIEAGGWFRAANHRLHDRTLPPPWVLVREMARLEARIAALENSTSWRLTAPLRWFKQCMEARRLASRSADHDGAPRVGETKRTPPDRDPFADYAGWILRDEAALYPFAKVEPAESAPGVALILTALGPVVDTLAETLAALRGLGGSSWSLIAICAETGAERSLLERFAADEPAACVLALQAGTTAAAGKAAALAVADADFIGFLDLPDRLAPVALRLIGEAVARERALDVVFADEDVIDASGRRCDPFFKPGWDPELHAAGNLFGRLLVLRRGLLRRVGLPPDGTVDSWYRALGQRAVAACRPDRIHHIPAVLCHRPEPVGVRWQRVAYPAPRPDPLVSIIVPTKNRSELLKLCAEGVLERTDYAALELLVLDNGTEEPESVALLRELAGRDRVRVLPLPGPFNWSSLNNAGARAARGEILVLLNNDIAILRPDWLSELVAQAIRPPIGAVGARLLYPDGTLEHAGMVIDGDGIPRHVLRGAPDEARGLNGVFDVAHGVSVVTGACLALRRATFFEVGGLDEGLAVSCNDVDLCLRLLAYGYRNVWTPHAVLEHREMASRGPDRTQAMQARAAAELDRLSRNWGSAAVSDPHFNPNLVLVDEQPRLRRRDHVADLRQPGATIQGGVMR
jgi:GT2 family glycosyltransferase